MKLSQLLSAAGLECTQEREITGLTCDSRQVEEGMLFAALEGAGADGRDFIPQAVAKGAAAVLCRGERTAGVPIIAVPEPRAVLAQMSAEFYGRPADRLTLIGVTGTKGKTTTTHMLRDILTAAGYKPGLIGTLGAFVGREKLAATANTTPEPIELHRILRQMAEAGCTHAVMEVSSQAMKQHRLAGIAVDVGVFLNLSPDHIGPGEHESFEEYRSCKGELFRQCRRGVGNGGDPAWDFMAECLPPEAEKVTFGGELCRSGPGLITVLEVPGRAPYRISMPGVFNGQNAMAALTAASLLGVGEDAIRRGLAHTGVPGRFEVYPAVAPFDVVIDYAHNGAGFRAIFSALREGCSGRILAVFGAGGDRPPMRRWELARAAAEGADFAVLTEDNPRSESAEEICARISAAMPDLPHVIIPDRRAAIRHALAMAKAGDVVALLGKGHEEYIETNGVRRRFSEREVLEEYFGQ